MDTTIISSDQINSQKNEAHESSISNRFVLSKTYTIRMTSSEDRGRGEKMLWAQGVILALLLFIYFFLLYFFIKNMPEISIIKSLDNPPNSVGDGVKLLTDNISVIGKMALTATTALWAVLLTKGNRMLLVRKRSWGLFWSANLFLVTAFLISRTLVEDISIFLYYHGYINVSEGRIGDLLGYCKMFFCVGILNVGGFIILCLKNKSSPTQTLDLPAN